MRILLIHPNFPGQFQHLLPRLARRGDEIWGIGRDRPSLQLPQGVRYAPYRLRRGNGADTHPLVVETESKVLRGEAAAGTAERLAAGGLTPELIVGHPGWGDMLFLDIIWPEVPQLHYVEFFHGVPGTDNDFPDVHAGTLDWRERARSRMKNANHLLNLNQMSRGVSPTRFQRSLLPEWAQLRTEVIHDGIDTDWLCPDPSVSLTLPGGITVRPGDPVITFVNRTFEPYRGIHVFLEALARLQRVHADAVAVLVGSDTPRVSYGAHRSDGRGWLAALREEMGARLDWSRVHALGAVNHSVLRSVYRISAAHVYLTYPFVLSWSLLEAMSCGCLVVGSDTAPVQEVIEHGCNGLLVPFSNADALANTLMRALRDPVGMHPLRERARGHIQRHYAIEACQGRWLDLLQQVAEYPITA